MMNYSSGHVGSTLTTVLFLVVIFPAHFYLYIIMHVFVIVLHGVLQHDIKYNATKYLSVFVCGTKHEQISKPKKISPDFKLSDNNLHFKIEYVGDLIREQANMSMLHTACRAHLCSNHSKVILPVTYKDAMMILLKRPRWNSASEMFVAASRLKKSYVYIYLSLLCVWKWNHPGFIKHKI